MAQILNDNFETGDFSKWTSTGDYEEVTIETGISGMQGTYCAKFPDSSGGELIKALSVTKAEVFGALDFKGINASGGYGNIVSFEASGDTLGMLYADSPGITPIKFQLVAYSGYYDVELGRHEVDLDAGVVYHIEYRYIPHATAGVFQVKLNNVLVIDYSGPTAPSTANVDIVRLGMSQAEGWDSMYFYADQVILDDTAWPNSGGESEPPPVDEFAADGLTFALSAPRVDQFAATGLWIQLGGMPVDQFRGVGGFQISAPTVSMPTASHFAASGYLALSGTSEFKFAFETNFAAGCPPGEPQIDIELGGECILDSILPTAMAADGYLALGGVGVYESVVPQAFAAAGYIVLAGTCQFGSKESSDFAAAGGFRFGGKGLLGDGAVSGLESAFAAAGGFALGSWAFSVVNVTYPTALPVAAFAAIGGFELSDACILVATTPTVFEFAAAGITFQLAGVPAATFLYPSVTALAAAGGFFISSPGAKDAFEAWVLSGQAFEPSIFTAFNFNSFAQHRGQSFAAGEDGIYLLGAEDDDGHSFKTGARIGPVNFGSDRDKRIRGIQFGNAGLETMVRVESETGEGVFTPDRDDNRVVVSRDIQGREFVIDIADFLELSQFEITPLNLARR